MLSIEPVSIRYFFINRQICQLSIGVNALGIREIRRHIEQESDDLHTQLRAILRAAVGGSVNFGTTDLLQYFTAADRNNPGVISY